MYGYTYHALVLGVQLVSMTVTTKKRANDVEGIHMSVAASVSGYVLVAGDGACTMSSVAYVNASWHAG